jgi:hypothetical protein
MDALRRATEALRVRNGEEDFQLANRHRCFSTAAI